MSPRQLAVVPVSQENMAYCTEVRNALHAAGFQVFLDSTSKTMNKKIREAQLAQYNFILVLGKEEQTTRSVNIRTRDGGAAAVIGVKPLDEAIAWFQEKVATFQ
jgi:threonyl-tRNA synthetase